MKNFLTNFTVNIRPLSHHIHVLFFAQICWTCKPLKKGILLIGWLIGTIYSGAWALEKITSEDYIENSYTRYGEFNQADNEEEDALFAQFGRYAGISLGSGYNFVVGNRALLYQGGIPVFDARVHYWFNFQYALMIHFFFASHQINTAVNDFGRINAALSYFGLSVKYYVETQNLNAALTFANPFVTFGGGFMSKSLSYLTLFQQDTDNAAAITCGFGFEFPIRPQKSYFTLEARGIYALFKDTYTTTYRTAGIPDLTGFFILVTGSVLFTW